MKTRLPLRSPAPQPSRVYFAGLLRGDQIAGQFPARQDDEATETTGGLDLAAAGTDGGMATGVELRVQLPPTDAQLESYAQQALYRTGVLSFSRLWVEVRERRALLMGTLEDDLELSLALQALRRINGIESVEQRVRLQCSGEEKHVASSAQPGGQQRSVSVWLKRAAVLLLTGWFSWRGLMLQSIRQKIERREEAFE